MWHTIEGTPQPLAVNPSRDNAGPTAGLRQMNSSAPVLLDRAYHDNIELTRVSHNSTSVLTGLPNELHKISQHRMLFRGSVSTKAHKTRNACFVGLKLDLHSICHLHHLFSNSDQLHAEPSSALKV